MLEFSCGPNQTRFMPDKPVADFPSASYHQNPLLYPGKRPEGSYLTDGQGVYYIETQVTEEGLQFFMRGVAGELVPVDEFLRQAGVPTMDERIPVLAFGANVNPASLASKFKKAERPDGSNNALIVPTIYASLPGHDVVWSGGPGVNGNFIAILYRGEETKDTTVEVAINFLTPEQVLIMHGTELSYNLSSVDVYVNGEKVRAYYYHGNDNIYLRDGKPVAIESIKATDRTLPADSTTNLVTEMLADPGIVEVIRDQYPEFTGGSAHEFVNLAMSLKGVRGAGVALKRAIHDAIAKRGKSRGALLDDAQVRFESWANVSTLATWGDQKRGVPGHDLLVLPSQVIPPGLWKDKAARFKVVSGAITEHLIRSTGLEEAEN